MAKLTAKERNALPAKDFAGDGRSYPIPDKAHASNAKARATEMWETGRLPTEKYRRIVSRANSKLKTKGK